MFRRAEGKPENVVIWVEELQARQGEPGVQIREEIGIGNQALERINIQHHAIGLHPSP